MAAKRELAVAGGITFTVSNRAMQDGSITEAGRTSGFVMIDDVDWISVSESWLAGDSKLLTTSGKYVEPAVGVRCSQLKIGASGEC